MRRHVYVVLLSKAEIEIFAFIEYPATSKRTSFRRLDEEEVCSVVVTTKSLVSVTFCCSASAKNSLVKVDWLPGFVCVAKVLNFWSARNPHASSLKIREVWCRNLNIAYIVRNLLRCRLRHGVASYTWNSLRCLSLCIFKEHISNWAKGDICCLPSVFQSFVFHLLFDGSSEHSGFWSLKKAGKASGTCLVFLRSVPASCFLQEWLL